MSVLNSIMNSCKASGKLVSGSIVQKLCDSAAKKEQVLLPTEGFFQPEVDFDMLMNFTIYMVHNNNSIVIKEANVENLKRARYYLLLEKGKH